MKIVCKIAGFVLIAAASLLARQFMGLVDMLVVFVLVAAGTTVRDLAYEDEEKVRYKKALHDIASNDAACGKPFHIAREALGHEERTPDW